MANLHFFVEIHFESTAIFEGPETVGSSELNKLKLMEIKTLFYSALLGI